MRNQAHNAHGKKQPQPGIGDVGHLISVVKVQQHLCYTNNNHVERLSRCNRQ